MYSKLDLYMNIFLDLLERLAIVALFALVMLALPAFWGVAMVCEGSLLSCCLGYSLFTVSVTCVYVVGRTLLTEIGYNGTSPFII